MNEDAIKKIISNAKRAAELADEFKSETYHAFLLSALLSNSSTIGSGQLAQGAGGRPTIGTKPTKAYSASELFSAKPWKSDLDKVVLAGAFLEQHEGRDRFTIQDIRACLLSAKVPLPKNINLPVLRCVQRGWLMETPGNTDGLKSWALTQSGEKRVSEIGGGE